MSKLVHGVGINDADYVVQIKETVGYLNGRRKQVRIWVCPFYQTWSDMLSRGYSRKLKLRRKTYKDVFVCKEWHRFSTFKTWMEQQDYAGKQLDKDLLVKDNKVYSPETCVFVSRQVNMFLIDRGASRGKYKLGCHWLKRDSKYMALCSNPFTLKNEYLGLFITEDEAHQSWLSKKLEHAYNLAAIQTDERIARAIISRYENYQTH